MVKPADSTAATTPEPDVRPPGDGLVEVRFRATSSGVWCGGMAPRPEDEARLSVEVPRAGSWVVRPGDRDSDAAPVARGSSDAEPFVFRVAPGTYCLAPASREPGLAPPDTDPTCWAELQRTCEAVIDVTGARAVLPVEVNRIEGCSWHPQPCSTLPPGPPPPSAPPADRP